MSQHPSNISQLTSGAQGEPIDPSAYRREIEFDEPQSQNSASNTSGQQGTTAGHETVQRTSRGPDTGGQVQPYDALLTYRPASHGGSQAQGSTAGAGQAGAQGGGYGGGNQNGSAGSTSANKGSSGSGR